MDAALVTSPENVFYLTGFTGSSGFLFVTRLEAFLVTDFRYQEQAESEVSGAAIHITRQGEARTVAALARRHDVRVLGFEASLAYGRYSALEGSELDLVPMGGSLERMRERKSAEEAALIGEAVKRAEDAFIKARPHLKAGVTERSFALRLEANIKKTGSVSIPFDIIVASGPNSSRPHAGVTDRKLAPGDLVTIDWGAEAGSYFSDMTRTFLLKGGSATALKKRIYSLVLKANRKAVKHLRAGAGLKETDAVARNVISKAGHGEHFGHGLGHGVGLQVHERPRLSPQGRGKLKAGAVVTVEPGIYLPGVGGVRIEDMALIGEKGAKILTKLPVELEIIV